MLIATNFWSWVAGWWQCFGRSVERSKARRWPTRVSLPLWSKENWSKFVKSMKKSIALSYRLTYWILIILEIPFSLLTIFPITVKPFGSSTMRWSISQVIEHSWHLPTPLCWYCRQAGCWESRRRMEATVGFSNIVKCRTFWIPKRSRLV